MRKTILAFAFLLIVILLCGPKVFCQSYDSTNFIQVTLVKIDRIFEPGGVTNKLTVISRQDTAFVYMRYVGRETRENLNRCVLIGREQWETILKNRNR